MNRNQRRLAKKQAAPADPASRAGLEDLFASGLQYYHGGQFARSEHAFREILALAPRWAEAHGNLGAILEVQGKFNEAEAHYLKALKLKPDSARICYNLGNALKAQGKAKEAIAQYKKALRLEPDYPEAHNNLGVALKSLSKLEEAVGHYRRALELKPAFAEARNNLGNALKESGEMNEAQSQYEQALELKPDYAEAYYNYSELKTFRPDDVYFARLEALEGASLPESQKRYIHFALAKALDDIGDYARAFEQLLKGNALQRQSIHYNEAAVQTAIRRIREAYSSDLFERFRKTGDSSPVPIFIVGMPRSGTTLIEQILSSHPHVHGAGELDILNHIAEKEAGLHAASVSALRTEDLRRLGKAYLAQLPPLPQGKSRITDKRPLNFFYVGLIRLILPNARIIHVRRNPADTCFSCFSKLFAANLGFSYDLAELGHYYRHYDTLMAHWQSVLPKGATLDVRYEDLIGDFEGQVRRLLDYCDLSWNERCLNFHETGRPVTTASAAQVRQPLFNTSVGRWHRYEKHLGALLDALNGNA